MTRIGNDGFGQVVLTSDTHNRKHLFSHLPSLDNKIPDDDRLLVAGLFLGTARRAVTWTSANLAS